MTGDAALQDWVSLTAKALRGIENYAVRASKFTNWKNGRKIVYKQIVIFPSLIHKFATCSMIVAEDGNGLTDPPTGLWCDKLIILRGRDPG
ncbi:hypothetical protein A9Q94_13530 [Rhodobacterales bacterium 56_14_T64]|nr:hypothetical protein A9Q94_13530 [Rhodobacterales bacterium 56_14_T64]